MGFWNEERCGSVASLFANKVPFLVEMGDGGGGGLLCGVVMVDGGEQPWGADEGSRPIQVACSLVVPGIPGITTWLIEIVDPCSLYGPPHRNRLVQLASIFRFEGVHGISFRNHPIFTMWVLI